MDNISARLREERERLKLSQTSFGDIGGASKPSQVRYESGERTPDGQYFAALARAGVDILYVLTGIRKTQGSPLELAERASSIAADLGARDTLPVRPVVSIDAYAMVALHDAFLSAGPGIANGSSNIIDHLAFRRDWLQRVVSNPALTCLARVKCDSMLPTLSPGDMVLIDTARKEPAIRQRGSKDKRRSPIYAFVENGEARIKRIERPDQNLILLLSDNPDYPPETRAGVQLAGMQMAIIGKVVWWGHTASP